MYTAILAIHNVLRWVVVLLGVIALIRAYVGFLGNRQWSDSDRKIGVFFASAIDMQLLIGLILYFFLSDITRTIFTDFSGAMANGGVRFFVLEHALYMVLALVFVHLGSILPRKVEQSKAKFARAAIWFTLTFLVLMLGIPWFRSLFPGLS
jgi:uncharacterized membrane protein YozB (DUF420 family)